MIYNLPQVKQAVGETWYLNENLGLDPYPMLTKHYIYEIKFVSNGTEYSNIDIYIRRFMFGSLTYLDGQENKQDVYADGSSWFAGEAYRTITFLEPPTGDLLAWLQANAVKQ